MTLNGVMAITLRYFTEFAKTELQKKRSVAEFMQEFIVFLVCVQYRRKESSRSLSHLLMSFLSGISGQPIKLSSRNLTRMLRITEWYKNKGQRGCGLGRVTYN